MMLKAIHAQEDLSSARAKAEAITTKLVALKLSKASELLRDGVEETLSYYHFPQEHWRRIRTIERIMREVRRRTRVRKSTPTSSLGGGPLRGTR